DVISPEEREQYLARDPHNIVHLTLPDDAEQAGRDLADWRGEGGAARGQEAALLGVSPGQPRAGGVPPDRPGVGPPPPPPPPGPARAPPPRPARRVRGTA